MARIAPDSAESREIDAKLASWQQGDVTFDDIPFIHIANLSEPLSGAAAEAVGHGNQILSTAVRGFVVLTQSCDIVRSCSERPYVELSPLVEVDAKTLSEVKQNHRVQFAYVPEIADRRLVADLDRVMTVEKSILAGCRRELGCTTDTEVKAFARALARKRARFAFPDEFTDIVRTLRNRIVEKTDKRSLEGQAIRALREIRVRASPSWGADSVEIMIWFIRESESDDLTDEEWADQVEAWVQLISRTPRFADISTLPVSLDDLTARDYVESDPLDLDHLSTDRE